MENENWNLKITECITECIVFVIHLAPSPFFSFKRLHLLTSEQNAYTYTLYPFRLQGGKKESAQYEYDNMGAVRQVYITLRPDTQMKKLGKVINIIDKLGQSPTL